MWAMIDLFWTTSATNMHTLNRHSGDSSVTRDGVLLAPYDYAVLTMLQAASDWAGTSSIAFRNLDVQVILQLFVDKQLQYLSKIYVHISKFGRHIPF